MYNIGIFIYDGAEILDFCGPFEVFNLARQYVTNQEINVFTIAETQKTINTQGLFINPTHDFVTCPKLDILLVPGGDGMKLTKNEELKEFIKLQSTQVEQLLSVCTGSLVYGVLDLLDGLEVTTHFEAIDTLGQLAPHASVDPTKRYVDNGKIVTSAGISAGIDMSLHVCEKLWGLDIAIKIAEYMEYEWRRTDENISLDHLYKLDR